jgi:hypothetical protein
MAQAQGGHVPRVTIEKVRDALNHWTLGESCAAKVRRLDSVLRGWGGLAHVRTGHLRNLW